MKNLVVVSRTVCADVGGPKNLAILGPTPCDGDVADTLEPRYSPTCVTIPNFVSVGQIVWTHVGVPKILQMPVWYGVWRHLATNVTTM